MKSTRTSSKAVRLSLASMLTTLVFSGSVGAESLSYESKIHVDTQSNIKDQYAFYKQNFRFIPIEGTVYAKNLRYVITKQAYKKKGQSVELEVFNPSDTPVKISDNTFKFMTYDYYKGRTSKNKMPSDMVQKPFILDSKETATVTVTSSQKNAYFGYVPKKDRKYAHSINQTIGPSRYKGFSAKRYAYYGMPDNMESIFNMKKYTGYTVGFAMGFYHFYTPSFRGVPYKTVYFKEDTVGPIVVDAEAGYKIGVTKVLFANTSKSVMKMDRFDLASNDFTQWFGEGNTTHASATMSQEESRVLDHALPQEIRPGEVVRLDIPFIASPINYYTSETKMYYTMNGRTYYLGFYDQAYTNQLFKGLRK